MSCLKKEIAHCLYNNIIGQLEVESVPKSENLTSFLSPLPRHISRRSTNHEASMHMQLSLSPSFCKHAFGLSDHLSRHILSNICYELNSVLALF